MTVDLWWCMKKPKGAMLQESDGTYWKSSDDQYYWWREGWGWVAYAGIKNQAFYNKFRPVMVSA